MTAYREFKPGDLSLKDLVDALRQLVNEIEEKGAANVLAEVSVKVFIDPEMNDMAKLFILQEGEMRENRGTLTWERPDISQVWENAQNAGWTTVSASKI